MTQEEKAKAYDKALERAKDILSYKEVRQEDMEYLFPELAESEDERIRKEILNVFKQLGKDTTLCGRNYDYAKWIAWLEKQGSEPNWCHHKVDLSNCSEEYRKAYYDGWNNCNMQHSQCKSEGNYVVKCLINGMKFYYEDNEDATWGTEKFPMKVKDILSWLEKQGETYTKKDVDDAYLKGVCDTKQELEKQGQKKCIDDLTQQEAMDIAVAKCFEQGKQKPINDTKQELEKPTTIDIDKMVDDYANNKERGNEEFGKPVNCMIRAYRQGLNDAVGKTILKPVWSEEDETGWTNTMIMIKECASHHYTKDSIKLVIDWLYSLKERIGE